MTELSYGFTAGEWTLENHYAFYDPYEDKAQLWEKITDSPHLGPGWPCRLNSLAIFFGVDGCVANKPKSDGIYFGGVSVHQLIGSWSTSGMSRSLSRSNSTTDLDHLRND